MKIWSSNCKKRLEKINNNHLIKFGIRTQKHSGGKYLNPHQMTKTTNHDKIQNPIARQLDSPKSEKFTRKTNSDFVWAKNAKMKRSKRNLQTEKISG